MREPIAVETEFATRALANAPSATSVDDLVAAVADLEEAFADAATFGRVGDQRARKRGD